MDVFVLRDGVIGPSERSPDEEPFARLVPWNPLECGADVPALPRPRVATRLVSWSGRFGPLWVDRPRPEDHRTWGPAGFEAFYSFCANLGPALRDEGVVLCFRPNARHFLSDPFVCLSVLDQWGDAGVRLLLDPTGFLTPGMLPDAADHLDRCFEALHGHPGVAALLLTNARLSGTPEGATLMPSPVDRGEIAPGLLRALVRRYWGRTGPIVVLGERIADQLEVLGL